MNLKHIKYTGYTKYIRCDIVYKLIKRLWERARTKAIASLSITSAETHHDNQYLCGAPKKRSASRSSTRVQVQNKKRERERKREREKEREGLQSTRIIILPTTNHHDNHNLCCVPNG